MNELLKMMSDDMKITPCKGEDENGFAFRVCYSALGMWCLKMGSNSQDGVLGTSKANQSQVLGTLLERFSSIFPQLMSKFIDLKDAKKNFAVLFRNIYEETGYLLTDENNNNIIANYGRGLRVGNKNLYFGYPTGNFSVNGLGIYADKLTHECELRELLIRDSLTVEEYLSANFNELDFIARDINVDELSFFNPCEKYKKISESWGHNSTTEFTIARKSEIGPYYKVICSGNSKYIFADEQTSKSGDRLTDYEYRRLLFALKHHYGQPITAKCNKIDEAYSTIYLPAHLPNREYYLIMLLGWPNSRYTIFDKSKFILRTEFLPTVELLLENIGIEISTGGY